MFLYIPQVLNIPVYPYPSTGTLKPLTFLSAIPQTLNVPVDPYPEPQYLPSCKLQREQNIAQLRVLSEGFAEIIEGSLSKGRAA